MFAFSARTHFGQRRLVPGIDICLRVMEAFKRHI
jgi:hypothetical protein